MEVGLTKLPSITQLVGHMHHCVSLDGLLSLSMSLPHCIIGKMKGLAFITDPDGYWIEILNAGNMAEI